MWPLKTKNEHTHPSSLPPHPQLGVLVSSYIRSTECVEKYGVNNHATLKPDGSTIVIAVSILTSAVTRPGYVYVLAGRFSF